MDETWKPETMSSMPQLLDVELLWVQEETQYALWNISCDGLAWGTQHKGSQGKLNFVDYDENKKWNLFLCQLIMSLIRNLTDGPQLKATVLNVIGTFNTGIWCHMDKTELTESTKGDDFISCPSSHSETAIFYLTSCFLFSFVFSVFILLPLCQFIPFLFWKFMFHLPRLLSLD